MKRSPWLWVLMTVVTLGDFCGAYASSLPVPRAIKKDVKFWEQIFAKYKARECVFHDSWNLNVIYGVHKMGRGSRRTRKRGIERRKRQITAALRTLASGRRARSRVEHQVQRAIPKYLRSRRFYRQAAKNVRCQQGIKEHFNQSLARSKKYLPMIRREMRKHRLPSDLAYLPHLESGFHPRAHSKVGARGLWQFMPAKAREAKLRVSRWRDERIHPRKATRAAAKFLARNYRQTKSWPLALTGYNYGINGIRRGIKRLGTNNFVTFQKKHRSPIFKFAARNFYPSFVAVVNLAKAHEKKARHAKKRKSRTKRRRRVS